MNQSATRLAGVVVLISVLLAGVSLRGAGPIQGTAEWNRLGQLKTGQEVEVVLNDAKSYKGKFQSVSDTALTVRLESGDQPFDRQNILRVSAKASSRRLRNIALGGVAGLGAGAGIGAATNRGGRNQIVSPTGVGAAVGAVIGLGAGAALGAALPSGEWREIYRARKREGM